MDISLFEHFFILTGICIYGIREDRIVWKFEYEMNQYNKAERMKYLFEAKNQCIVDKPAICLLNGLCFWHYTVHDTLILLGPFFTDKKKSNLDSFHFCCWPALKIRCLTAYEQMVFVKEFEKICKSASGDGEEKSVIEEKPLSIDIDSEKTLQMGDLETDLIYYNHLQEKKLLYLICLGKVDELSSAYVFLEEIPGHIDNLGLRTQKNLLITLNTLSCRAAIDGGVPIIFARSVCAYFVSQIERADSRKELFSLSRQFPYYYCSKVKQCKSESFSAHVKNAIYTLRAFNGKPPSLAELAEKSNISEEYLSRCIKREAGKTYTQLLQQIRLERAVFLLQNTAASILEISENAGFSSSSYFDKTFKKTYHISPQKFRTLSIREQQIVLENKKEMGNS